MSDEKHAVARRPIAFFNFTAEDLSDENIDATAERVAEAIRERSLNSSAAELDNRADQMNTDT